MSAHLGITNFSRSDPFQQEHRLKLFRSRRTAYSGEEDANEEADFGSSRAAGHLTTGAMAQTTVTTGIARDAVQIEPEYRTKIKTYVTEKKLRPITTTERIAVGTSVPANIELQAVPSDWGPSLTKYRYVYSNDRVMFVDPDSRRVVYELD